MRRKADEFCSIDQNGTCWDEHWPETLLAYPAAEAAIARARQLRLVKHGFSVDQINTTYAPPPPVIAAADDRLERAPQQD